MKSLLIPVALLTSLPCLYAAETLTLEKSIQVFEPSDLQFSPDGARVAFTVQEPPSGRTQQRHIWVYDLGTRQLRQWTTSAKSEQSPRWSPDGHTLAFLSDRQDSNQIWLLPAEGGEAVRLTTGKNAIQSFKWSRDGKRIAFLAADPPSEAGPQRERDRHDEKVMDTDSKPTRLWVADIAGKSVRRITNDPWTVRDIEWMPNGESVLAIATNRPNDDRRGIDRLYTVSLADGRVDEFLALKGPFQRIRISPSGKLVAFVSSPEDGPSAQDLFVCSLDTRTPRNLTASTHDRPVMSFQWLNDSEIAALFSRGFHTEFAVVSVAGAKPRNPVAEQSGDISNFAMSLTRTGRINGTVAYTAESAAMLPELYIDGKAVSHFNSAFADVTLSAPEFYRYKSFDGTPIEAALFRGAGTGSAQPQPAVILIHGGPAGAWRNRFDGLTQLLVARGYTVMEPNIRGSSGYGQKFLASNRGDWGGGDFKDVMAGVDDLVNRKIADPNRLGIAGWSYGGYMAEWAITQTNRFKVAVSGAGMADLATEFGTESRSSGDEWYYGTPYEDYAGFQKSSPIQYIRNAKTPTLILQGEADTTDPMSQSQMLFRGLKRYNVPTEFVLYPREPHNFREQKHILDRDRRIVEWIDKYLGRQTAEK